MKQLDFDFFNAAVDQFTAALVVANIDDFKTAQFNCILEECRELQAAYRERNELLILDGIVDVVWTGCVYAAMHEEQLALYPVMNREKLDQLKQYYFETFIGSSQEELCGILGFKENKSLKILSNMVDNAIKLGYSYDNFDLDGALIALAKENLSKLNFTNDKLSEVFRNNKLQKKDEAGNLYPWYEPANFNAYIFN